MGEEDAPPETTADNVKPELPPLPSACEPMPEAPEKIPDEDKSGAYQCAKDGDDPSCTAHVAVCGGGGCIGVCYKYKG